MIPGDPRGGGDDRIFGFTMYTGSGYDLAKALYATLS